MSTEEEKPRLAGLKSFGMAGSLAATVFNGLGHAPFPGMFKWDPAMFAEELRKEKRIRRKQKVIGCLKKFVAFLFSQVGLAGMVVVYSIIGGLMFQAIETPNEIEDKMRYAEMKVVYINKSLNFLNERFENFIQIFNSSLKNHERFIAKNNMKQSETDDLIPKLNINIQETSSKANLFFRGIFSDFQANVTDAVKSGGWDGKDQVEDAYLQWSFPGSLLYAVTVITTIGYGHIAPKTKQGRVLTMVYALIGIPLTFLYLSNIGNFLGESLKKICCGVCCCLQCKQRKDKEILRIRKQQRLKELSMITYVDPAGNYETNIEEGHKNEDDNKDVYLNVVQKEPIGKNNPTTQENRKRLPKQNNEVENVYGGDCVAITSSKHLKGFHEQQRAIDGDDDDYINNELDNKKNIKTTKNKFYTNKEANFENKTPESKPLKRSENRYSCMREDCNEKQQLNHYERHTHVYNEDEDNDNCYSVDNPDSQSLKKNKNNLSKKYKKLYNSPKALARRYYYNKNRLYRLQRLALYFNDLKENDLLNDEQLEELVKKENEFEFKKSFHKNENSFPKHTDTYGNNNNTNDYVCMNEKQNSFNDKKYNKYIKKPVVSNRNSSTRRKKKNTLKTDKSTQMNEDKNSEIENSLKRVETAPDICLGDNEFPKFYLEDSDKNVTPSTNDKPTKKESSILDDKEQFVESTHGLFNRKKRKPLKKSQSLHQRTPTNLEVSITPKNQTKNKNPKTVKYSGSFEKARKPTDNSELNKNFTKIDENNDSLNKYSKPKIDLKKSSSIKDEKTKQLFLSASLKMRPASVIGLKSLQDVKLLENSESEKISPAVSYLVMKKNMSSHFTTRENGNVPNFEHEISPANFLLSDQALLKFDEDSLDRLHEQKVTVPIYVCLIIIISYISTGAMLFKFWEDWDYIASSYFCFITLSTIGFGDIVPGTHMNSWTSNIKLVSCTLWLAFGLSLLAMCFNLMQEGVKDKCRMIGMKVGLLKKEDEEK